MYVEQIKIKNIKENNQLISENGVLIIEKNYIIGESKSLGRIGFKIDIEYDFLKNLQQDNFTFTFTDLNNINYSCEGFYANGYIQGTGQLNGYLI